MSLKTYENIKLLVCLFWQSFTITFRLRVFVFFAEPRHPRPFFLSEILRPASQLPPPRGSRVILASSSSPPPFPQRLSCHLTHCLCERFLGQYRTFCLLSCRVSHVPSFSHRSSGQPQPYLYMQPRASVSPEMSRQKFPRKNYKKLRPNGTQEIFGPQIYRLPNA